MSFDIDVGIHFDNNFNIDFYDISSNINLDISFGIDIDIDINSECKLTRQ